MKIRFFLLLLASLKAFSAIAQPSAGGYALTPLGDDQPFNPDQAAATFAKQLNSRVPFFATKYHFTLVGASVSLKNHSVIIDVRFDADHVIVPEKEYYLPLFFEPDVPWDITLITQGNYDICLQVSSDKTNHSIEGYAGQLVSLFNEDLRRAYARAVGLDQIGLDYLAKYARSVSASLPLSMGKAERLVQCYYADSTLVMTLEYEDSVWPGIRRFLVQNMDNIRISRAQSWVDDTTNAVAISANVSKSNLRHIYRNRSHTDSLHFTITPWILDQVFQQTMQQTSAQPTPNNYLMVFAQQLQRQSPVQVNETTRLLGCAYDSVALQMTFLYEISEATMLQFESNPQLVEAYQKNFKQYFQSDDPQVVALVRNLIAADATVRYSYRSAHGRQPIVLAFSASELSQIVGY